MGSNKEKQAARHEALNEVANAHPTEFAMAMQRAYAKRSLGTYSPRLSAQERATRKAEAEKRAAAAKITALAEKNGIGILLVDDPDIQKKMQAAADGTFQGVKFDWRGDENGFADEEERVREAVLAQTDDNNPHA